MLYIVRSAPVKHGETTNDEDGYVSDQIMMRYDGVKNTRTGEHNPNATTWEDLSGNNRDLKTTSNIGKTLFWEDDGIVTTAPSETIFKTDLIEELNGQEELTIEAIVYTSQQAEQGITRDIVVVGSSPDSPFTGAGISIGDNNDFRSDFVQTDSQTYSLRENYELNKPTYVALTVGKNEKKLYIDGKEVLKQEKEPGTFYITDPNNMFVSILNFNYDLTEGNSFVGKVYGVRIYKKELSNTEIEQNYTIDKTRFNLDEKSKTIAELGYINDDVFAHYNGIYNTRSYGHRNTNYWEDLSGNNRDLKMNTNLSQNIYWEENGLTQDKTSSMLLKTDTISEIQDLTQTTVEILFEPRLIGSTANRDVFSIIQKGQKPYTGVGSSFTAEKFGMVFNDASNSVKLETVYELNKPICASLVAQPYNGGTGKTILYVNGTKVGETSRLSDNFNIKDESASFLAMFNFEPDKTNMQNSFVGKIYSARVYSRALTEQEVKQNYQVDQNLLM